LELAYFSETELAKIWNWHIVSHEQSVHWETIYFSKKPVVLQSESYSILNPLKL